MDWISDGSGEGLETMEEAPQLDTTHPCSVAVLNVPVVANEKVERLKNVLLKILSKVGGDGGCGKVTIDMPLDEAKQESCGMLVVTYEHKRFAEEAVAKLDNIDFDKGKLRLVQIDKMVEMMARPEKFEPSKFTVERFARADERDWLLDDDHREQILLRYQDETEIYWVNGDGAPELCYGGEREKMNKRVWCDSRVEWSSWGSFLCTFHRPGIVQWAGPEFLKRNRFMSNQVKCIAFSPDEEHVVTWNGTSPQEGDPDAVKFYHVRTGEMRRAFKTPEFRPTPEEFPLFLWSGDGKFFGRCGEKEIFVYAAQDMQLIQDGRGKRTPLKFESLDYFAWSPRQNIISSWSPGDSEAVPARLTLTEIPSRRELASKNLFNIRFAELHWQSEGEFLCVQVMRMTSKNKGLTNLEIFRMSEKDIPVDMVEMKGEVVKLFSWEPRKNRFAVLTEDEAGKNWKCQFFKVKDTCTELVCTYPLKSGVYNNITWGPYGSLLTINAVGSGELLFMTLTPDNKAELFHTDEHFMLTDVSYDPSSRYVITSVCQPMGPGGFRLSSESGFALWTFQGRQLYKMQKERMWQVCWRPHPPSLLPEDKVKHMQKNFKEYSKKYDTVDDVAKDSQRREMQNLRAGQMDGFNELLATLSQAKKELYRQTGFDKAWDKFTLKDVWEDVVTTLETDLEKTEEIIQG